MSAIQQYSSSKWKVLFTGARYSNEYSCRSCLRSIIYVRLRKRSSQNHLNNYFYLPFSSNHPMSIKLDFIKGELIRYARNSSKKEFFDEVRILFYKRLRRRGFPRKLLLKAFKQVRYSCRNPPPPPIDVVENNRIPPIFTIPFNLRSEAIPLSKIILKDWKNIVVRCRFTRYEAHGCLQKTEYHRQFS